MSNVTASGAGSGVQHRLDTQAERGFQTFLGIDQMHADRQEAWLEASDGFFDLATQFFLPARFVERAGGEVGDAIAEW